MSLFAHTCQTNVAGPGSGEPISGALAEEILRLKRERNALILAHNYQIEAIQRIADITGDSLGLSYQAAQAKDVDVIVFCGVHFMAETAKILNPEKTVLLPDLTAGCSLADSCPAEALAKYQSEHPGLYTVAYINCSAAVKSLSDVIVTSGNAEKIVSRVPQDKEILFVPDQNLGQWVMRRTHRQMRLWPGNCHVHVRFNVEQIEALRAQYPNAPVLAHPECTEGVREAADEVCSTERMISYCRGSAAQTFIIATEPDMIHRLHQEIPDKTFVAANAGRKRSDCDCFYCEYMKRNTLEKLRDCLKNNTPEITLPADLIEKARGPIVRMLDWSR